MYFITAFTTAHHLSPILSLIIPLYELPPDIFNIRSIVIFKPTPRSSEWPLVFCYHHQIPYPYLPHSLPIPFLELANIHFTNIQKMKITILDLSQSNRHSNMAKIFLISNFRRVLNILCFILGSSPESELYMPTFRSTLFHLHRQVV